MAAVKRLPVCRFYIFRSVGTYSQLFMSGVALKSGLSSVRDVNSVICSHKQTQSNECAVFNLFMLASFYGT